MHCRQCPAPPGLEYLERLGPGDDRRRAPNRGPCVQRERLHRRANPTSSSACCPCRRVPRSRQLRRPPRPSLAPRTAVARGTQNNAALTFGRTPKVRCPAELLPGPQSLITQNVLGNSTTVAARPSLARLSLPLSACTPWPHTVDLFDAVAIVDTRGRAGDALDADARHRGGRHGQRRPASARLRTAPAAQPALPPVAGAPDAADMLADAEDTREPLRSPGLRRSCPPSIVH